MPGPSSVLLLLGLVAPSLAQAAPVLVGSWDDADYATIDAALADTSASEPLEILLSPGDWDAIELDEARAVLLRGSGALDTRIAGATVSHADASLSLMEMTVAGEASAAPGTLGLGQVVFQRESSDELSPAVRIGTGGQLHASQVLVSDWSSDAGALVVEGGGAAELRETAFVGCVGIEAAAVHVRDGALFGDDLDVMRGAADAGAGLVLGGGSAVIRDLVVRDSRAAVGGAISISGGTAYLSDVVLDGNEATTGGHVSVSGGVVDLKRVVFRDGHAVTGAGVWLGAGTLDITNALFEGLVAEEAGAAGAIEGGVARVSQATVYGVSAPSAGGFLVSRGGLTLSQSILSFVDGAALEARGLSGVVLEHSLLWGILAEEPLVGGVAWEVNGTVQNPLMRSAAAGDYVLLAASPGLDIGVEGERDPDGTKGDLGMYGGRHAWPLPDADGDGFVDGRDCDDTDPEVHEAADDRLYDGIDQDCDGRSDFDQDRDGYDAAEFGGTDCDDTDFRVFPGADEGAVDGVDQDCDGEDAPDADGDGWVSTLDCDDQDAAVHPDARESWYDGVDQDCGGGSDYDRDGDGAESRGYGGTDCDDNDSEVHPGAQERAGDRVDQDCDGELDPVPPAEETVPAQESEDEAGAGAPRRARSASPESGSELARTGGCSVTALASGVAPVLVALVGLGRRRERDDLD